MGGGWPAVRTMASWGGEAADLLGGEEGAGVFLEGEGVAAGAEDEGGAV